VAVVGVAARVTAEGVAEAEAEVQACDLGRRLGLVLGDRPASAGWADRAVLALDGRG
jgi:hypothetical protein